MNSRKTRDKKKRDRNTLTFYEKIAVIRYYENNQMSRNSLARMFRCCTTQIRRILERKEELLSQWESLSAADSEAIIEEMTRKRKEFEMKALAFILHQWVEKCRLLQLNMTIDSKELKMVALKIATVLNLTHFKPTAKWIEKFRLKFKYKSDNLAKPRPYPHDYAGTLSVEDVIIEYKHCLPSFLRDEISKIITTNRGSPNHVSEVSNENFESVPIITYTESNTNQSSSDETIDYQISATNVLQYLSLIQEHSVLRTDSTATEIIGQLELYIRENYALSTTQGEPRSADEEDIILLE